MVDLGKRLLIQYFWCMFKKSIFFIMIIFSIKNIGLSLDILKILYNIILLLALYFCIKAISLVHFIFVQLTVCCRGVN